MKFRATLYSWDVVKFILGSIVAVSFVQLVLRIFQLHKNIHVHTTIPRIQALPSLSLPLQLHTSSRVLSCLLMGFNFRPWAMDLVTGESEGNLLVFRRNQKNVPSLHYQSPPVGNLFLLLFDMALLFCDCQLTRFFFRGFGLLALCCDQYYPVIFFILLDFWLQLCVVFAFTGFS